MSGNTFAGDRANNVVLDADGNDSIYIAITAGSTLASGTIYGGGGNDSIQIAGSGVSNALFVQTNAGADVFTAISAGDIKSSFIGMGAAGDIVDFAKSADILNSDIHLGKGADSIFFNGADMASGASFSGTTIYGGAGADLLASEGIVATNKTVATTFEYNAASDSTIDAFDTIAVAALVVQPATPSSITLAEFLRLCSPLLVLLPPTVWLLSPLLSTMRSQPAFRSLHLILMLVMQLSSTMALVLPISS